MEDEIQMRFYLMSLVKSLGFDPVLAKDGVQGLDTLTRIKPSAIILDIMMPKKGGAIVYQELVTHPEFKTIPIIFFSGVDRKAFFHHIKMLNINLEHDIPEPAIFVAKDADSEYLKEIIKKCVLGNGLEPE
ncbi:MAG: response regulator [Deltaproteobacteria bacterium]|uniref:response regulator n=1 Tax=Desulfobacula sp. TaxID=2593537 RepID=UPI0019982B0F|nr:response regulator [Candidatus Desulfobacula maris]MBL6993677.1 response regulator [Desulfobacula sp.]